MAQPQEQGTYWDIIAISSGRRSDTTFFYEQLEKKREQAPRWAEQLGIGPTTLMVPVPDPFTEDGCRAVTQVGSGGAALNAILHVAEQISTRRDVENLCVGSAFSGYRIAILLCGISKCDVGGSELGKAFAPLPLNPPSTSGGMCNAELALLNLQRLATPAPAVWVSSTEWLMHVPPGFPSPFANIPVDGITALALPSPATPAVVDQHGVYKIRQDGQIVDVVFRPGMAGIERDDLARNGQVLVIAPVTRLAAGAAEALLSLHNQVPFDACTYYGSDSSSQTVPINFYLDFLLACSTGRERYVDGTHPNAKSAMQTALHARARAALAKTMRALPLTAAYPGFPPYVHSYPSTREEWLTGCLRLHAASKKDPLIGGAERSRVPASCAVSPTGVVFGSWLGEACTVGSESLVLFAELGAGCVVGDNCRLYHCVLPPNTIVPHGTHLGLAGDPPSGVPAVTASAQLTGEDRKQLHAATEHIIDDDERHIWLVGLAEERGNRKLSDKLDVAQVRDVLLNERETSLTDQLGRLSVSTVTPIPAVLTMLDNIVLQVGDKGLARVMYIIADFLACCAKGKGGLRSGPNRNPRWLPALQAIEAWDGKKESRKQWVAMLAEERRRWLGSPESLIRAARHFEGVAATITARCVDTALDVIPYTAAAEVPVGQWVKVAAPARIDLAGGWTDTPPVSYETGGFVVNAAILINGAKPLQAYCRLLEEPILRLWTEAGETVVRETGDMQDYASPQAPAAIMKAALVAMEAIDPHSSVPLSEQLKALGGGLEMQILSTLPVGSGLGGSSILGSVLLQAIATAIRRSYTKDTLVHLVLRVEQLLTSAGGWQDHIGGMFGGIKTCHSAPKLPLEVKVDPLSCRPELLERLSQHMVLVYSGRARLARNLLQNVLRRWAARLPDVVDTVSGLRNNAADLVQAVLQENIPAIGWHVMKYWQQKQAMAGAGAEPPVVKQVMAVWDKHIHGYTLGGAGGGGFIVLVTKEPNMKDALKSIALGHCSEAASALRFYDIAIDPEGMTTEVDACSPSSCNSSFNSIPTAAVHSAQAALAAFAATSST
eukprot:TRINITY_DN13407_c0_g1_i1.p1 TRINITY_DN13407_c0_g1~~TRINITY_DN13407_c0_g1_i1.p1  ORF type:complete len:1061 (+),score=355.66 TRINITY_DN13407_c0_g1_i1:76-3258(+)